MGSFWANHGTKIIGLLITLLGTVSAATPDTLTNWFGPHGPGIAVAAGGLLTVLRGFTNSANAAAPPTSKQSGHIELGFLGLTLSLLMVLSACAALGLTAPKTFDQQLDYAYAGVDGALQVIPPAITAHQLSSAKGAIANTMILNVKALLDQARSTEGNNLTSAQNDLTLASTALTAVQAYLTQNGVKTP